MGTEITNKLLAQPKYATFFISIILPPDVFHGREGTAIYG